MGCIKANLLEGRKDVLPLQFDDPDQKKTPDLLLSILPRIAVISKKSKAPTRMRLHQNKQRQMARRRRLTISEQQAE